MTAHDSVTLLGLKINLGERREHKQYQVKIYPLSRSRNLYAHLTLKISFCRLII